MSGKRSVFFLSNSKSGFSMAEVVVVLFFVSTAIVLVDGSGTLIAGTVDDPHYLSNEGRSCNDANKTLCPFRSTGYFLGVIPH